MAKKKEINDQIEFEGENQVSLAVEAPKNGDSPCVSITNKHNSPQEFAVCGKFYRTEPRGQKGDTICITTKEYESKEFKSVMKYFVINGGK